MKSLAATQEIIAELAAVISAAQITSSAVARIGELRFDSEADAAMAQNLRETASEIRKALGPLVENLTGLAGSFAALERSLVQGGTWLH